MLELMRKDVVHGHEHEMYALPGHFSKGEALSLIYDVSKFDKFTLDCIIVDEPFGMDSDWSHFRGPLANGRTRDEFIERFSSFQVERTLVKGDFDNSFVQVTVNLQKRTLSFNYEVDLSPLFIENVISVIEGLGK